MTRTFPAVFLAAILSSAPADAADAAVDAVTSASVDAETGASRRLEPIQVSGGFSVAYAVNDDGALFIAARDLTDAYRRDELASDSLFKGKVVVIRGEVEKTSKKDAAKPWLSLAGDGESGKRIRCALRPGQLLEKNVEPGGVVRIRGVCDGMKLSVSVSEGEIIE
ncbi:MAG: OB-fold putative lipoprotein [Planctomycetota bacterium]|jgi:hypothetical protein|nr:OB-fold putative lipoprotein [Planctomycetota bacterium]